MSAHAIGVVTAIVPHSVATSEGFAILATFVAINTIMYAALAVAKILPKLHPTEWLPRRSRRSETRSIYPDAT